LLVQKKSPRKHLNTSHLTEANRTWIGVDALDSACYHYPSGDVFSALNFPSLFASGAFHSRTTPRLPKKKHHKAVGRA
jgi:hypothetical protein